VLAYGYTINHYISETNKYMKSVLETVKPQVQRSARAQITDSLRELLVSGKLNHGDKLPPTCELATLWGTPEATIQQAFQPLVKEGLLRRTPRLGTFVQKRTAKLTRVGVYYSANNWEKGGSRFFHTLSVALQREWQRHGVDADVWVDTRPAEEQKASWPALTRAAQERRLQAVIVPLADWPHIGWFDKLSIPVAYFSPAELPTCVTADLPQFMRLAFEELRRQGCRSVGMLPAFPARETEPNGRPTLNAHAMTDFVGMAVDQGVTLCEEWVYTRERSFESQAAAQRFGYETMMELWGQSQRPDGLIVTDDVAATGVIAALLERGVKVPDQLKLVLYKNSAVDIFCPPPATFVELSTPAVAAALVEQVQKQLRGEACTPIRIGFRRVVPAARRTGDGGSESSE
jgi:DNA-binding LacI/PurR family transcriptional regulator